MKKILFLLLMIFSMSNLFSQEIALLKYQGGGDWYSNPTSLPNLIAFSNETIGTQIASQPATVETSSPAIFEYPFVHMTGHGNVYFSDEDAKNLRDYLLSGGFLHVDDNYGMNSYFREAIKKVFPNQELTELPKSHPIFNQFFEFPNGLPKIHEHDAKPPQAFGLFDKDRLILLFTYESDLGNGWEDQEVHQDPEEVRLKALKMGANILHFVFTQN
ncbi:DUF4159 domain-containing protein [Psychroflexus maritimus]|uniref:DUF4159 domain-containing protein n=1 Tax=Psychroflexus maritimus TaxID=2714865 RepID=A0A967AD49_9FLAO|nr:DUF4159 domain-containing protein [Psychroflexus maritimus]NGZ89500.1 DUF4159 domain-containing protein [Psychroflexus maritimus]